MLLPRRHRKQLERLQLSGQPSSLTGIACLNQGAVVARVATEPFAKSLVERTAVSKPQTLGELAQRWLRLGQPGNCQFTARAVFQALVCLPLVRQAPTQGSAGQAQAARQAVGIWPIDRVQCKQLTTDAPGQAHP